MKVVCIFLGSLLKMSVGIQVHKVLFIIGTDTRAHTHPQVLGVLLTVDTHTHTYACAHTGARGHTSAEGSVQ